jgi:GT2 family glycosyltransferase
LSLQGQTFRDFEVVLVDNASTDDSLKIAESFIDNGVFPLKIIRLSENVGFCKGNNIGFRRSEGRYIVLLNNDTYVPSRWLEELVKVLDMDSSVGICQSVEIGLRDKKVYWGNFVGVYGKRKFSKVFEVKNGIFKGLFYASGTSLIIRRRLVKEMGGLFDEKQFTGDMDLSWRVRLLGFDIVTSSKAICYHFVGYSSKLVAEDIMKRYSYVLRDAIRTYIKNYNGGRLFKRFPLFFFFLLLKSVYESLEFNSPLVLSLMKATVWNILNLKDSWNEHLKVQSIRKVFDDAIENSMLPYPAELYFLRLKLRKAIGDQDKHHGF